MYRGVTALTIDDKGRFAMPTRLRDCLHSEADGKLVATIDPQTVCLLLYPLPAWEAIEKKLTSLPSFNQTTRRIQRLLVGHATELELDGNGRVLLPSLLRDYANLDKRMMLVGQGHKFELWSERDWMSNREVWLSEAAQAEELVPEELASLAL